MSTWGNVYRSRARRVIPVTQKQLGVEGKLVLRGTRVALKDELYDVTRLKVSRRMFNSLRLQFAGRSFVVGYDKTVAPHARARAAKTGISKTGGHRLDMNPNAHLRANTYPQILALRRQLPRQIAGSGGSIRIG